MITVVVGKEIEKIKGDFESYLNGLNMVGEISYSQYSELYDEGVKQIQRAYELGKSELLKENAELKEVHESDKRSLRLIAKKGAELEKKISILLSCKNCPENKGGYICEKEYEDKCLAQKIQYIKELKEENAELKKQLGMSNKVYNDNLDYSHHIEDQLTKAENLIKKMLYEYLRLCVIKKETIAEAKQFLKE